MAWPALRLLAAAGLVAVAASGYATYRTLRPADPVQQADRMVEQGKYRDAQTLLRAAIAKRPDDPELHLRMARVQTRLADPIAAEREYRRAIALGAPRNALISEVGEQMLLQGRYAAVLSLVPARGAKGEPVAKDLMLRAAAQVGLNDLPAAEATLADARATAPDAIETLLIAARVAAARNDPAATKANVDAILKRDPDQVEALLMQQLLQTAAGDRVSAMRTVDHAIAIAPWSAMARIDRAYLLMFNDEDAKAQADVDTVLAGQPMFVDAIYLQSILLARRGNFADASAHLSRLDGLGARFPQVAYYQGLIASRLGQNETAAEAARRYNQLVPNDPTGLVLRANTAIAIGKGAPVIAPARMFLAEHPGDANVRIALARLLSADSKPADARRTLDPMVKDLPTDLPTLGSLGLALLETGDAAAALPILEKVATAQPKLPDLWRGYTQAAIQAQQGAAAQRALKGFAEAGGSDVDLANLRGLIQVQDGDLDAARATWTAELAKSPNAVALRFNLARLAVKLGNGPAALEQLAKILTQEPANLPALQSFLALAADNPVVGRMRIKAAYTASPQNPTIISLMADALTAAGTPKEAIDLINRALPDGGRITLLPPLARAQAAAGLIDDAIDTNRTALGLIPRDDVVRSALLALVRKRDGVPATQKLLEEGIKAAPDDLAQMSTLVGLTDEAEGLEAAQRLAASLAADPAHLPYAAVLEGDLLRRHGDEAGAAKAYAQGFQTAPSLVVLLRLARAEARSGDAAGAAAHLRAWLAASPRTPDAAALLAKLVIAEGGFAEAVPLLQTVAEARPGDGEVLNDLAWSYFKTGDARAAETARAAFLVDPAPGHADTLGWILASEGKTGPALLLLRQAVARQPNDPVLRFHLASALAASGDDAAAKTELEAIALPEGFLFPDGGDARALAARLGVTLRQVAAPRPPAVPSAVAPASMTGPSLTAPSPAAPSPTEPSLAAPPRP